MSLLDDARCDEFLNDPTLVQQTGLSPTGRYTTIVPLAIVIFLSAMKELVEDLVGDEVFALVADLAVIARPDIEKTRRSTIDLCWCCATVSGRRYRGTSC
jgi:hypothetical protein